MHAFARLAIRCPSWRGSWQNCALLLATRPLMMLSGAAKLASRRFMPMKTAVLLARQVRRTTMSGASPLTYGTGSIAPGAMADASDRALVAKSGCNDRLGRRVCENNWIGHTDGDIRAGRVCGWRVYRGLESARGACGRPTQGQCCAQAPGSSTRRSACDESARAAHADICTQARGEATQHTKGSARNRARYV
ncbi:hypothetical protein SAMN06265784_103693 [Paraburkholderia susongensis]|uniref:Uncharacterized protein n=1 Tax=Paraburkholderia susongensis TaxID=1515439 RepID=A0A1X7KEH4_9BURK|nr:hypothetical protein SAMN06265784_103693 [Paraburkholderia susongensis]